MRIEVISIDHQLLIRDSERILSRSFRDSSAQSDSERVFFQFEQVELNMKTKTQTQMKRYEKTCEETSRESREETSKESREETSRESREKTSKESREKTSRESCRDKSDRDRAREIDQLKIKQFTDSAYVNFQLNLLN